MSQQQQIDADALLAEAVAIGDDDEWLQAVAESAVTARTAQLVELHAELLAFQENEKEHFWHVWRTAAAAKRLAAQQ